MDYNDGTHLAKWQWDIMQEPAVFDGFLYSDEDKMAAANKKETDELFGEISDLSPEIAPSDVALSNYKGGIYGCVRTMYIPPENDEKRKFCIKCSNCAPLPNNPAICQRYHDGIDISLPFGTPIKAICGGTIEQVVRNDMDITGLGSFVVIKSVVNGQNVQYIYGHLQGSSFMLNGKPLAKGMAIKKGEFFAETGNTGNISKIEKITKQQQHCHLQVIINRVKVNPKDYVSKKLQQIISDYEK